MGDKSDRKYREVWVNFTGPWPDEPAMSALINGDLGFLTYLRCNGDAGFTSRNRDYAGPAKETVEFFLTNGQRDEYPAAWMLPLAVINDALTYFLSEGRPPNFVCWHNDSDDGSSIEFIPKV